MVSIDQPTNRCHYCGRRTVQTVSSRLIFPFRNLQWRVLVYYGFADWFSFTIHQTIAIMGAHTIGFAHHNHSGFDGLKGLVRNPTKLNHGYYQMLVGANNTKEEYVAQLPDRFKETFENGDVRVGDTANATGPVEEYSRTMPNQFYCLRRSEGNDATSVNSIMTRSDIALVGNFEERMEEETKVVGWDFLFSDFMEDCIRRDRRQRRERRLEQKREPRQ